MQQQSAGYAGDCSIVDYTYSRFAMVQFIFIVDTSL